MPNNHIRVSDRIELIDFEKSGFVHRKGTPTQRILRVLFLLIVIVIGVAVLVHSESRVGSMVCTFTGMFMLYFGLLLERQRKLLMTSEFMNALFGSAIGKNNAFTCIVRQDGEILYCNKAFQTLFSNFVNQEKRDIATLSSLYGISAAATQSIMTGLMQSSESTVPALIDTPGGKQPFMVMVEPIERPAGFVLLRGKAA